MNQAKDTLLAEFERLLPLMRTDLFIRRGVPEHIRSNNGPEYISKAMDQWAYWNKVELDFSRPRKPTDNALIESFNGRFRAECLNENWFLSMEDARRKIEAWRRDYNTKRPHSSPGNPAPEEFSRSRQVAMAGSG
jgi:putative transposase